MPYRDTNLLRSPEYLVAPEIEPLQIRRKQSLFGGIMDNVFFEIGSDLRYKIGTLPIALKQIVHLGFDDLLDMRLFDIIRSNIKANTESSNDNYAEYRKCQRNAQAKSMLKPRHEKSGDNQDHEPSRSDHSPLLESRRDAIRAYGCVRCRWFLARLPILPIPIPCD